MTELTTDYTEYEAFVSNHPNGHFLQSHLWAAQKPQWHWQAIVSRNSSGTLRGSMAILTRKLPFLPLTIAYGCRGPVCDPDDVETRTELLLTAKQVAKTQKAALLRLDPDIPAANQTYASALRALGFRPKAGEGHDQFQPQYVYRLDLHQKTEADLLANFHPKTRYNIRLAQRRGVTVRVCGAEAVPAFSALMEETGIRDGFRTRPASYFTALLQNLGSHARLYLAEYEGEPLAGAIAIQYGDKSWYLYGASSNRHREKMPNYLLQWEMIRWALNSGCRVYDFRGVSGGYDETKPLDGLTRFKAGFGGELVELLEEHDLILRPHACQILRRILALHGRLCRANRSASDSPSRRSSE